MLSGAYSSRQKTPIIIKMVDSPAAEEPEPVVEPPPDANLYLKEIIRLGVEALTKELKHRRGYPLVVFPHISHRF
jgi:hypothetical protein